MEIKETKILSNFYTTTHTEKIHYIKQATNFEDLEQLDLFENWQSWNIETFEDTQQELIKYFEKEKKVFRSNFSEFHRTKNNSEFLSSFEKFFDDNEKFFDDESIGWQLKQMIYLLDEAIQINTNEQLEAIKKYINK